MSLALPEEPSDRRPIFTAGHVSDWMLVALTNNHPPQRQVWNAEQSLNNNTGLFRLRVVDPDDIPVVRRGLQGLIGVTDSSLETSYSSEGGNPFKYALKKAASSTQTSGAGAPQRRSSGLATTSLQSDLGGQGGFAAAGVSAMSAQSGAGAGAGAAAASLLQGSCASLSQGSWPPGPVPGSRESQSVSLKEGSEPLTRAQRYYQELLKAERKIHKGWETAALEEESERAAQMAKQMKSIHQRSTETSFMSNKLSKSSKRRTSADSEVSIGSLLLPKEESSVEELSAEVLPFDGKLHVEIEVVVLPNDPESRSTGSPALSESGSSPRLDSALHDGSLRSDSVLGPAGSVSSKAGRKAGAKGSSRRTSQQRRGSQGRSSVGSRESARLERVESRLDLSAELNSLRAEMDLLQEESQGTVHHDRDGSEASSQAQAEAAAAKKRRTRNVNDDALWARRNLGLGGTAFYVPDVERYALAHSLPPPPPPSLAGAHKTKLKPRLPLDISSNRYRDEAPSVDPRVPVTVLTEERSLAMEKTMRIADFYNALSRSMTALDRMTLPGGLAATRRPRRKPPRATSTPAASAPAEAAEAPPAQAASATPPPASPQKQLASRGASGGSQTSGLRGTTPGSEQQAAAVTSAPNSRQAGSERRSSTQTGSAQVLEAAEGNDEQEENVEESEELDKTRLPVLPQFNKQNVADIRKAIGTAAGQDAEDEAPGDVAVEGKEPRRASEAEKTQPLKLNYARFGALVDYEARKSVAWRTYHKREYQRQKLVLQYKTKPKGFELEEPDEPAAIGTGDTNERRHSGNSAEN
mmetsp:Transcript_15833/g.37322  ORF Transcript_15833/g.37322 Transcript_15833/m.37322 type:complete len:809 (+) Transcript_15833:120-2546(+)